MSLYSRIKNLTTALLLAGIVAGFISPLHGQGLGNSPYTVLGIGETYSEAFASNIAMGEAGVSTSNGMHINNLNPALWARNRITAFEFGTLGQYKQIAAPNVSQRVFGANLGYMALAFPAAPRWTVGFGLKPYSFVDFESRTTSKVPGTIYDAYYYYTGKGGLSKASITNAVRIGRYLSVGLEAAYLFGNVRRSSDSQLFIGDGRDYTVSRTERTNYSDFALRTGAAVRIPIKKNNKLNLNVGGTYNLGTDLNARQITSFELSNSSFPVGLPDTLSNNENGNVTLPSQYRLGVSLEWPYKLTLAVDYERQSWTQFRSFANTNEGFVDAGKVHVGAEYIPRLTSTRYFDLAVYRAGFSHGQLPYSPGGQKLNDTNASLGISLPIGRGGNSFTFTLVGGQRGVVSTQSLRERYGKVVLGLTLNDNSWFIKQRID
ncbi:outer membrane protein transport protein [Rhabdobacter roseus]|uniref:Long-chain fatty acid transport protein n=1 Tax=Rhabdobacter roseus TaxID=1655419 RepID=A0A840U4C1_9BACT|nr:hypothetical protein [Rhabdobacter roseus]MBB5286940.1 hypothetical protein [Rhabdobacter roseus]